MLYELGLFKVLASMQVSLAMWSSGFISNTFVLGSSSAKVLAHQGLQVLFTLLTLRQICQPVVQFSHTFH